MGPHDAYLLARAAKGIPALYGFPVTVLDPVELPKAAWTARRRRWRAEKLLDHIDAAVVPGSGCAVVIGFTKQDISTTKDDHEDWGVLGLGNLGGTSAVVSTYRAGRGVKGRKKVAVRTIKVVNHELGHVLGAPHDDVPGCLMNDARGTVKTIDRETGLLCAESRATIEAARGLVLPERDAFDWAAVLGN